MKYSILMLVTKLYLFYVARFHSVDFQWILYADSLFVYIKIYLNSLMLFVYLKNLMFFFSEALRHLQNTQKTHPEWKYRAIRNILQHLQWSVREQHKGENCRKKNLHIRTVKKGDNTYPRSRNNEINSTQ